VAKLYALLLLKHSKSSNETVERRWILFLKDEDMDIVGIGSWFGLLGLRRTWVGGGRCSRGCERKDGTYLAGDENVLVRVTIALAPFLIFCKTWFGLEGEGGVVMVMTGTEGDLPALGKLAGVHGTQLTLPKSMLSTGGYIYMSSRN
jgi:hypothetical protein